MAQKHFRVLIMKVGTEIKLSKVANRIKERVLTIAI